MSDSGAFCPRCGDSIEVPRELRNDRGEPALCDACYFEGFELVDAPDRIQVTYCNECGAVKRGKRWVDVGARDYTDVAIDAVTEELAVHVDADSISWAVDPEQVDQSTIRLHCQFTGVVRGTPISEEVVVPAKLGSGTCDRCGRKAGDYYEATVQVRAEGREPTDEEIEDAREIAQSYVADREAKGDRNAFITEIGETDDGLDVKVSTSQIGRAIADRIVDRHGGGVSTARRLITEDEDGQRVYRMSYAARLPPYRPDEVIDPEDDEGPVLVTSARGNLKGTRLATGERYEADSEEGTAPDAVRLGTREDAQETTLVAVEDDRAVQVLDPETYEAKTVARPDYLDPDAETVPVLKHRRGLHVLPAAGEVE